VIVSVRVNAPAVILDTDNRWISRYFSITEETIAAAKGGGRGSPTACIHRDRPVSENIAEFTAMKEGKYKEKGACLRMKIDLDSGNPFLWDPVAYRVKDAPHHRTGARWSE
jgi:glutaminyl-tRNA synthetase